MATQPSAEESLNFPDFFQIVKLDVPSHSSSTLSTSIGLSVGAESGTSSAGLADSSGSSTDPSSPSVGAGREPPLLFQGAQLRQYFGKVNKNIMTNKKMKSTQTAAAIQAVKLGVCSLYIDWPAHLIDNKEGVLYLA